MRKHLSNIICLSLFTLLFSCGDVGRRCGVDYFERSANFSLGEDLEVIECYDDAQFMTWMVGKVNQETINTILKEEERVEPYDSVNFVVPPPPPGLGLKDYSATKHDLIISDMQLYFSDEAPKIKVSENLYLADFCNDQRWVKYAIDTKQSLIWIHIQYPDWAGDAPC